MISASGSRPASSTTATHPSTAPAVSLSARRSGRAASCRTVTQGKSQSAVWSWSSHRLSFCGRKKVSPALSTTFNQFSWRLKPSRDFSHSLSPSKRKSCQGSIKPSGRGCDQRISLSGASGHLKQPWTPPQRKSHNEAQNSKSRTEMRFNASNFEITICYCSLILQTVLFLRLAVVRTVRALTEGVTGLLQLDEASGT